MRKYFWCVIFCFQAVFLHSQGNFSHVINIFNHNEYANYIHPLENDGYFIFGGGLDQIKPFLTGKNYILSQMPEEQNIYFFDSIFSERAGNYEFRNDTFYYLGLYNFEQSTRDVCLFKSNHKAEPVFLNRTIYTTNGDIIYPKGMCFDDQFIYTIHLEEFKENTKKFTVGKFLKLDYSGNVISEKQYDELNNIDDFPEYKNHFNYFLDIDLLADTSLLMSFLYNPKGFDEFGALYKTDLEGNVIWFREFDPVRGPNTFPGTLVLHDNTFIYKHDRDYRDTLTEQRPFEKPPVLYRMDANGNILWEHVFETYPSWHKKWIAEMIQTKNGDIVGVGSYYGTDVSSIEIGWIFRMNLEGELLWEKYYFDDNFRGDSWFNDVKEISNGDLILAGSIDNDVNGEWTNNGYGWVLRVDGDGCYYPGCTAVDTLQIIKASYYDSIPEFCPKGAKWTYGTVDGRYTGGLIYGYEEMSYTKDTLIDQKWCKIISRNYADKYGGSKPENIIITQQEQKIYQYSDDSFHLLFDFGAMTGDTLELDLWKDWFGNETENDGAARAGKFLCRIDSMAVKNYHNNEFKEYSCTLMCYDDPLNPDPAALEDGIHFKVTDKFFMIDGYWLFNTYACSDSWKIFHDLRCYEDDEFGFIQFGDPVIACDSILLDNVIPGYKQDIVLFPNPANSKISLILPESSIFSAWSIYQIDGRLVKHGKIENQQTILQISSEELERGIYLLKETDQTGRVQVLKFVKE